jgi:uncharacterized protein YgiM (DUF1202 family)
MLYIRKKITIAMKSTYLFLAALCFVFVSCSNDAEKFAGIWQSVKDPSKQITITHSGKTFSVDTRNIEPAVQGLTGAYNADKDGLEFAHESGDTILLTYDATANHIIGLGSEFEKATTTVASETPDAEETAEKKEEATPAENENVSDNAANCDKGDMLVITGNNVRVRNEPDLTKQNILLQVHKNYEVVQLDSKTVDGQKWYKICYDGNIGWVSGQYATKK